MNESTEYIMNAIRIWIWSGLYRPEEIQSMIGDLLEEDADEKLLRESVEPEFEKKLLAEKSWPAKTDCDRLDEAFEELNELGIVALHNAGMTQSDGLEDVGQEIDGMESNKVQGYCFYHGQDLERAVSGDGLMIAFGDLHEDLNKRIEIGNLIKQTLERKGLSVDWAGNPDTRLNISKFDWKRRTTVQ